MVPLLLASMSTEATLRMAVKDYILISSTMKLEQKQVSSGGPRSTLQTHFCSVDSS